MAFNLQKSFVISAGESRAATGGKLQSPISVAFETFGELNESRSNAVLVFHALSGDSHAAGRGGWWESLIGPGAAIDTDEFHVICANVLGGCRGSTGPSSTDPATGVPYGPQFPAVTLTDMARVQKFLLDNLGVRRLAAIIGGSMGGMLALEWARLYPFSFSQAIIIAAAPRASPQVIALHEAGRQAIAVDPNFNGGDYYSAAPPSAGLAVARMVGHISYLSEPALERKFGRLKRAGDYEVSNYLRHQGNSFTNRFDANSYVTITRAIDSFDLGTTADIMRTYSPCAGSSRFTIISYASDWLFSTRHSAELLYALTRAGVEATHHEIPGDAGHDSFLLPQPRQEQIVKKALAEAMSLQHPALDSPQATPEFTFY